MSGAHPSVQRMSAAVVSEDSGVLGALIADLCRYRDMKLHSILFGGSNPDQALRVAAGILGKRASSGQWPSGRYCQRCEAFPTMHRTWKPQSGVELEWEDMAKTN
jgi:hypothetical protein